MTIRALNCALLFRRFLVIGSPCPLPVRKMLSQLYRSICWTSIIHQHQSLRCTGSRLPNIALPEVFMTNSDVPNSEDDRGTAEASSAFRDEHKFELAWLELRMCWQPGKKNRLDDKKKQALAALIDHYTARKSADRPRQEFDEVLLRLKEEHDLRLKELARDERRSRKFQNAIIQIVRDNNAARLQYCRDQTEETPPLIAAWQALLTTLFS
jgi:hypothetical protein